MTISCPNCATRLQLDDAKVPSRPFTVRCPKCQQIINAHPPSAVGEQSALDAGSDLPTTTRTQQQATTAPAPQFKSESPAEAEEGAGPQEEAAAEPELARVLAALLQRGVGGDDSPNGPRRRPAWDRRRALVCLSTSHGGEVARGLAASDYDVFVAADSAQAVERMRESKIDVVVLDPEFDMGRQGAAQISREVSVRRPSERRRVIIVQVSPTVRTSDTHAAFLANANLVVNTGEVALLPVALDRTVHELNELYKGFNKALGVAEF